MKDSAYPYIVLGDPAQTPELAHQSFDQEMKKPMEEWQEMEAKKPYPVSLSLKHLAELA
jgi:hypothetical protein